MGMCLFLRVGRFEHSMGLDILGLRLQVMVQSCYDTCDTLNVITAVLFLLSSSKT